MAITDSEILGASSPGSRFFLVVAADPRREALSGAVVLADGLFLIRSDLTRSQLYHAVKRHLAPSMLVVAPLSELPKLKGVRPGAVRQMVRLAAAPGDV